MIFLRRKSVAGVDRTALAAIDVNTLRVLPFGPLIPQDMAPVALTASPQALYVAYMPTKLWGSTDDTQVEIVGFDLRTSAELPQFHVTDFKMGIIEALAYAKGNVVASGNSGRGGGMTAYNPRTGERASGARVGSACRW